MTWLLSLGQHTQRELWWIIQKEVKNPLWKELNPALSTPNILFKLLVFIMIREKISCAEYHSAMHFYRHNSKLWKWAACQRCHRGILSHPSECQSTPKHAQECAGIDSAFASSSCWRTGYGDFKISLWSKVLRQKKMMELTENGVRNVILHLFPSCGVVKAEHRQNARWKGSYAQSKMVSHELKPKYLESLLVSLSSCTISTTAFRCWNGFETQSAKYPSMSEICRRSCSSVSFEKKLHACSCLITLFTQKYKTWEAFVSCNWASDLLLAAGAHCKGFVDNNI